MAWTPVLGTSSTVYPELMLEWAPTSKPTDEVQTWEDITDRLRAWDWGYGRSDELDRFEAGTGSVILDNRDRELDPSNTAGGWYGEIKPRKMFRLRARWATVIYPVFVAYSRGYPQAYPAAGYDSVVKVDLVDAFAILQGIDLVAGFSRPEEMTDERIDAVLDAVNLPAALRDLDAGEMLVAPLEIDEPGTSALDHAKTVAADAEFGQFFFAKDGQATFHNRERRLDSANLHTFTDAAAGTLRYDPGFEPAFDETYLWNYVRVAGPTTEDEPGVDQDAASQLDYHTLTRPVSSELKMFGDRQALAEYQTLLYSQPALRVPLLPLTGAGSPAAMWPVILDLEVSDKVTVERFADSLIPMSLVQNVEGIRHSCRAGGPWSTSVSVSPADTRTYWRAGTALRSNAGVSTLAAP